MVGRGELERGTVGHTCTQALFCLQHSKRDHYICTMWNATSCTSTNLDICAGEIFLKLHKQKPTKSIWLMFTHVYKKHFKECPCTAGACPYDHMFAWAPSSSFSFVIRVTPECPVDPADPKLTPAYWPAHCSIESITLNQFKPQAYCLEWFHFGVDHFSLS